MATLDTTQQQASVGPGALARVLGKVSMFRGLTVEQAQTLLNVCKIQKYRAGAVLFKEGAPSTEMFMLMSGHLAVRKGGRAVIAEITPVSLVGEMGVITGEERSAQVVVMEDSVGLLIRKDRFDILLKRDANLDRKISKNIIHLLCGKIREDGVRLAEYEYTVTYLQKQVDARS